MMESAARPAGPPRRPRRLCALLLVPLLSAPALGTGCARSADEAGFAEQTVATKAMEAPAMEEAEEEPVERRRSTSPKRRPAANVGGAPAAPMPGASAVEGDAYGAMDDEAAPAKGGGGGGEAPQTRAWFPETFLFAPRVVTDADGRATVSARIPDRLTTWRVLGLAHSRDGALGGAVVGLPGRLPVYVDPVLPPFLRTGDTVALPIQAINTTDTPRTAALALSAEGATLSGGRDQLRLPAGGGALVTASLHAPRPGTATLRAQLRAAAPGTEEARDEVLRELPVEAIGRLVRHERAGTLGAPRSVSLAAPGGPGATDPRVQLVIVPGALAVLEDELLASAGRVGTAPADAAHALRLAADGPAGLATLGAPVADTGDDPEARARATAVRSLRILATQEALHHSRHAGLDTALLLGPAAARHDGDALLTGLADRMLSTLADQQRPDGTFGGSTDGSWTLQRVVAATAAGAAAARQIAAAPAAPAVAEARQRSAQRIQLRASGALERHAARIEDPYTASLALLSGCLDEESAAPLRALVAAAAVADPQGGARLAAPSGVQAADGHRPTSLELTALAALALATAPTPPDLVSDLSATVLAHWRPGRGWGQGRADLVALQVVTGLLGERPPERVQITLNNGDDVIFDETLDAADLRSVQVWAQSLPAGAGDAFTLAATPALPGLGFTVERSARDPWTDPPTTPGLELVQRAPTDARVGQQSELQLTVGTTARQRVSITVQLPAGVQVDADALRQREGAVLQSWEADDRQLRLELTAGATGVAELAVPVVPTLAGSLSSGATVLETRDGGRPVETVLAPERWTIRG